MIVSPLLLPVVLLVSALLLVGTSTATVVLPLHPAPAALNSNKPQTRKAQLQHHNHRRVVFLRDQINNNVLNGWERLIHWKDSAYHHHHHRHLSSDTADTLSSSMPLSNCHGILYTTSIQIGSQQQTFQVQLDIEGSDLWVLSSNCDESCRDMSTSGVGYDASLSETSRPLYENDADKNVFETGYRSGNQMIGTWIQDTVSLTPDLILPNQGFASVHHIQVEQELQECWMEGSLGLGPTKEGVQVDDQVQVEDYQTIRAHLQKHLTNPVFSLYLNDNDDYPFIQVEGDFAKPTAATSELVLGGIKSSHYNGCLQWHDLQSIPWAGDQAKDPFILWNLPLKSVAVMDNENAVVAQLPHTESAILVTDSLLAGGNPQAIGQYAKLNNLTCTVEVVTEDFEIDYAEVECDNEEGFTMAFAADCSTRDFLLIELEIKNANDDSTAIYTLGKDTLYFPVDVDQVGRDGNVDQDDFCMLGLVPIPGVEGLLLGEGFLQEYYSVFDFGTYKIGLAPRSKDNTGDVCSDDAHLEVTTKDSTEMPPTGDGNVTVNPTTMTPSGDDSKKEPTSSPFDQQNESPAPSVSFDYTPFPTAATTEAPANEATMRPPDGGINGGGFQPRPTPPISPETMTPPSGGINGGGFQPLPSPSNSKPYNPSTDSSSDGGIPLVIPIAVASIVGILLLLNWRKRRVRYERAAYFDDTAYRMGDMELREIY